MTQKRVWLISGEVFVVGSETADYLRGTKWTTRDVMVTWRGVTYNITLFQNAILAVEK